MKAEDLTTWNLVHDWCNGLRAEIPDMARRYLMDLIDSHANEVSRESHETFMKTLDIKEDRKAIRKLRRFIIQLKEQEGQDNTPQNPEFYGQEWEVSD